MPMRDDDRRPDVPPLLWGLIGMLVVAAFVLALGVLGPVA
jgi:hypothetical protein